ncbi:hypothetical protein HMPREF1084_02998 [Clostridium butyricum 60E.3]|uniref:Uncharacterized protein n=1 Tax=Clostridium butyricum TaxID=1492 RepID=A0A6L9EJ25_CLOBU|nr:hypothetical protein [Clostridium butyricum]POO88087.1 hypothetical protein C1H59_02520 [Clostridium sp. 3-3]ALP89495.1 hypothetical protein ATN24_04920 [Clostridium butyricum]ALS15960.1 hypothetical protein ATD26_03495 [Clostridium butyricum]ANF13108.1 hypothetical protein AZ909_03355 [Clostridium butyricum]AOR93179.1 hypothetical protein BBB49_03525 [Clostridium butyricum]
MEFKLNKIDTDIRKKIEEERKENKVHSGKAINVNKDFLEENDNNLNNKNEDSHKKKQFIIIDGIKYNKSEIKVNVEKSEKISIQNSVGRILDTKK